MVTQLWGSWPPEITSSAPKTEEPVCWRKGIYVNGFGEIIITCMFLLGKLMNIYVKYSMQTYSACKTNGVIPCVSGVTMRNALLLNMKIIILGSLLFLLYFGNNHRICVPYPLPALMTFSKLAPALQSLSCSEESKVEYRIQGTLLPSRGKGFLPSHAWHYFWLFLKFELTIAT